MKWLILFAVPCLAAQSLSERIIAGSGDRGDGGAATNAILDGPAGVASDSTGNVYIAESNRGVIRQIDNAGIITRLVGTGVIGPSTEGAAPLQTNLQRPSAIAIGPANELYFSDAVGCRILKLTSNHTVVTVIGTGRCLGGGGGFGFPAGSGAPSDQPPLQADIGEVDGITFDLSGRLLFTDATNHLVRRLDSDNVVRTIAGIGSAGYYGDQGLATNAALSSPHGIAVDNNGAIYIADTDNCRIRRVIAGSIATVAGTGCGATGTTAFLLPLALAIDTGANVLYIGNAGSARILALDLQTSKVTAFAGNGKRGISNAGALTDVSLDSPAGIAVTLNGIYVSDATAYRTWVFSQGHASVFAGTVPSNATLSSLAAPLLRPEGSCLSPSGDIYFVDTGLERVFRLAASGQIQVVAGMPSPTGYTSGDGGPATSAQIGNPRRIGCASDGRLYLVQSNAVRSIDTQGTIQTLLTGYRFASGATSLTDAAGLAIDSDGSLVISDGGSNRVFRYNISSKQFTILAGTGTSGFSGDKGAATSATLSSPGDVAFDNSGNLYIADRGNNRIRRVDGSGIITTVAGSALGFSYADFSGVLATDIGLGTITGLAVDAQNNLYICEYSRVVMVDQTGIAHIVAGFLGQDDAGTNSYNGPPLNGCNGLNQAAQGSLLVSLSLAGQLLTLQQPVSSTSKPVIAANGVITAAAFGASPQTAPGSWIEIYGSRLSSTSRAWTTADFLSSLAPSVVDGVSVTIGGAPALISYVSPGQINAMVPLNLQPGNLALVVRTAAGESDPYTLSVQSLQPGLLAPPAFLASGKQYVVALLTDGAFAAPSGAITGVNARPARPGEYVTLFGLGFGAVDPTPQAGQAVTVANKTVQPVMVQIGGVAANVTYSGLAPGQIGLYQFNLQVPNLPAGAGLIKMRVGSTVLSQQLYLSIGTQ